MNNVFRHWGYNCEAWSVSLSTGSLHNESEEEKVYLTWSLGGVEMKRKEAEMETSAEEKNDSRGACREDKKEGRYQRE